MRTSLNEIKLIEEHLLQQLPQEEELLFQARLILHPQLKENLKLQQQVFSLVKSYGRKQLRDELESVHQMLFGSPEHLSFRKKILKFFKR